MLILIRTDLGTMRLINTDNISYVDAVSSMSCKLELKSNPGFDVRIGMGIEDFYKVVKGEAEFLDLYVDQGYQKTIENSSKELGSLEFKEETDESKERLEEFKKELKPLRSLKPSTFSKNKAELPAKKEVDTISDTW